MDSQDDHVAVSEARQKEFKDKGLVGQLPQTLFKKNRAQFIKMFNEQHELKGEHIIGFFKGASEVPMYSGDVPYPEYQEAFFYYLVCYTIPRRFIALLDQEGLRYLLGYLSLNLTFQ